MNCWPMLGIVLVITGFALRLNAMLVVTGAALVTGLMAGMDPVMVIATIGKAFNDNRIISVMWIVLPVIGSLERYGLQQRAASLIGSLKEATLARLLIAYLLYRQVISAVGLQSTAGQVLTVRPLVAPMALAAAERECGPLNQDDADKVKAMAAATDNIGLFFGEDIFIAIGSIVLIQQTLKTYGIDVAPFALAVWAIPGAIAAFVVHAVRVRLFSVRLRAITSHPGAR
jgi:uncharacterized membrane protein